MQLNLTLPRKALVLLVGIPLVFELAFFGGVTHLLAQEEAARQQQGHARALSVQANTLMRLFLETATTCVIYSLTGSTSFERRAQALTEQIKSENENMRALTANVPNEKQMYQPVSDLIGQCVQQLQQGDRCISSEDREGADKAFARMHELMGQIFLALDDVTTKESAAQDSENASEQNYRNGAHLFLLVGALLNIALACGLAYAFNRGLLSRLDVLMDNILRLASRQPLNAPVSGADEIAQLDQFLRRMSTSLAEATSKERAAVEHAVDVICSIDSELRIGNINPACLKAWQYTAEDLIGSRIHNLIPPEDLQETVQVFRDSIDRKTQHTLESRIRCKDGSTRDTLWQTHWSQEENALFCIVADVTEQKETDRVKREFIRAISQDLKVPLSKILQFFTSLQDSSNVTESGKRSVSMANDSLTRLIDLVNELLNLEQMETGQLELTLARTSAQSIVNRSIEAIYGTAQQKNIAVEFGDLGELSINADESRLVQVLVNLLSNAVKFSPADSTITIAVEDQSGFVKFAVQDQGRGVPEEMRAAIFERFKQTSAADERAKGGSGLGLAICKAIVERHGGTIGVESNLSDQKIEVGRDPAQSGWGGSVFWFRIPQ